METLKNASAYREAYESQLAKTMLAFPPGTRVHPVGTTTGNWGATVREIDAHRRREMAADFVFLDWDNGNKFAVCITDIEKQ